MIGNTRAVSRMCSRVGEIMSDADMKRFTGCKMPMGTVRWSGRSPTTIAANIVTRLGVQDDDSMPQSDWITDTHHTAAVLEAMSYSGFSFFGTERDHAESGLVGDTVARRCLVLSGSK